MAAPIVRDGLEHQIDHAASVVTFGFDLDAIEIEGDFALGGAGLRLKKRVRARNCHISEKACERLKSFMLARGKNRREFALMVAILVHLLMVQTD